jgi:peptidoglycan/xylan/chitin deacetylase (PgdA/CDA1 family)
MRGLTRKALLRSGLLRIAGRIRGGGAAILMYHSVMEDPRSQDEFLGRIAHSREVFRGQMELLARRYQPATLDQIKKFVRGEKEFPARSVVVTFDDGYRDNYEIAAPVLGAVGVPATFYVTVECLERRRLPWPARIRFVFRSTKKQSWDDGSGTTWPLAGAIEREQALLRSCDECCKLTGAAQDEYVAALESRLDTRVPVESGKLMMTADQMRALAGEGHIIGSHTMTHPNMAYVSASDALRELTQSKRRLEEQVNAVVSHFSYPCPARSPHWTEQTVIASRDAGYQTAVTTDRGLARRGDHPLRLKRVLPTKTVEGLQWNLECIFAGRPV